MAFLTACPKSDAPVEIPPTVADEATTLETEIPVGRLGDAVVPVHYRLELRIDPTQESFSGKVSIDARVSDSLDSLWMHGKGFDIDEIFLTGAGGNRLIKTPRIKHLKI